MSQPEAAAPRLAPAAPEAAGQRDRLGPLYSAGPVQELARQALQPAAALSTTSREVAARGQTQARRESVEVALAGTHGAGPSREEAAYGQTVRLQGRTDATYDGGRFHTEDVRVRSAEPCEECGGRERIHVTGVLVATYRVRTRVTLPNVSDFSGLTNCQRQRVADAIDTVLRPHEQEHVTAFEMYNGTTRQPFDLTLCRSEFDGTMQSMFEEEEGTRRASAQAASDALDPFHFDVDLDCEDESTETP